MNANYAGFWLRFVAAIIDGMIIGMILSVVAVFIFVPLGIGIASQATGEGLDDATAAVGIVGAIMGAVFVYALLAYVIQTLYHALMESSKYQGSFGKMALGLIVTDEAGNKIDFTKALIRNLGKIISHMILYIGFIMAGFTEKKQALHDMIAKTLVVKKS